MMTALQLEEGNKGLGRITRSIVDAIGIAIVTGQHRPNELLPVETAMAARYEASRSVLREAIKVLNAKGLVTARPRAGTFVSGTGVSSAVRAAASSYVATVRTLGLDDHDALAAVRRALEA